MIIEILGIPIANRSKEEVRKILEQFLGSDESHQIVTVNPEMLVAAKRNREFWGLLKNVDLAVADGFGLQLVTGGRLRHRITGNDILKMLLSLGQIQGHKIYFLGGAGDQARQAAAKVKACLPQISIQADPGGLIAKDRDWFLHPSVLENIKAYQPDILVVGLGHEKQEFFIRDFLPQLPSVKVAVGVGGVFAFLSGEIKRAPKFVQKFGLEWLWRLAKEPHRLGRILRAVIVFPILYFWDKLTASNKHS